jgi:hypothetical protein
MEHERTSYLRMCQVTSCKPQTHWSFKDVLKAFLEEFCEGVSILSKYYTELKCGKLGTHVIWITTPPKKLCYDCLRGPIHNLNVFQKMLKHYGLAKKDVEHVPKYCRMKSYFSTTVNMISCT